MSMVGGRFRYETEGKQGTRQGGRRARDAKAMVDAQRKQKMSEWEDQVLDLVMLDGYEVKSDG